MKLGLGNSYDSVQYLPKKLRGYLDLTKPASSLGVAGAYFAGSVFYFAYTGGGGNGSITGAKLFSIVFVSMTMFLAHSASQAMNMAEDAEMDRDTPHKENRPIPSGIVSEEEARTLAWILSAFALGRSYLVNWRFGLITTFLIFMGIFYNLEPIRAKARWYSIPWQAVSRGLFLFPAVWAAYGDVLQPTPWILGLFMFFYVFGFQNSADIADRHVDEEYGIKTLVVMFGPETLSLIAGACTILMGLTIYTAVAVGALPFRMLWMMAIMPFCMLMVYYMDKYPTHISETTGNHPAWLWFYVGMVLSVVIPMTVELV